MLGNLNNVNLNAYDMEIWEALGKIRPAASLTRCMAALRLVA